MPKMYKDLKKDEICIYQAFTKVKGVSDLPDVMGAYVNKKGIDADDEEAVIELAKKYGFKHVEGMKGEEVDSEFYRFDNNAEIIAVITRSTTARARYSKHVNHQDPKKNDPVNLLTDPQCKSASWHAIYGKTNDLSNVTWIDDQNIFSNGPTGATVSVCFVKKIVLGTK